MPTATSTRHILTILAVADLERAVAFYEAAFGFAARVRAPVYVELELDGGRGLGLYQRDGFVKNTGTPVAPVPHGATSSTELYFRVDDLNEAITRIERAGARLLSARAARDWGDDAAYYADPEGNVVVIAAPSAAGAS